MRKFALGALLIFPALAADFVAEGDRWWSYVQVLADDNMEGRNAGSAGHRRAADYMASQFERAGLKPAGTNGYLQPLALTSAQVVEEQSSLSIVHASGDETKVNLGGDVMLGVRVGLAEKVEAEAVFCGYALQIPEYKFDDYAGLDLKGKICLYITGGPSDIPGPLKSHYSGREERWKGLQKAGVIGLVAIQDPKSMDIPWERSTLARLNATMTLADAKFSETPGQQFAATFNPARANMLLADSGHTFAELLKVIETGKALPRFPLKVKLKATVKFNLTPVESQNVIGIIPGSDPKLKNEYVVYGAHLDHLGIGANLTGDKIYNGAMDDGSGLASLITIANLYRSESIQPKRSILFAAVTGEEKGLLGSRFYNVNPTVPAGSVVGDINMDMYLPLYPLKYLEVQGLDESTMGNDVRAAANSEGVMIQADKEPERNLFIRSDQYSFVKKGVPALAFKFGYDLGSPEEKLAKAWLRERYHAPSDDLQQPVDKAAAAKFNRIMLRLGARVADNAERPQWLPNSFFRRFAN